MSIHLIQVDGRPGTTGAILAHCVRLMPPGFFSGATLIGPSERPKFFEVTCWAKKDLPNLEAYSWFMLNGLWAFIPHICSHVLVVQQDGYILDPALWSHRWPDYDYIGAPWPENLLAPQFQARNVGNGGFSLRSSRLCREVARLAGQRFVGQAEDVVICQELRPDLEKLGMRFAPLEVAERFSVEWRPAPGPTFGFHGITHQDGRVPRE